MTPDDQEARTEPAAAGAFGIGGALFVPAQQAADASTAAQSMDRAMPNVKALEKSSTAEQPADHPRPTHNPVSILVLESGSVQAKAAQPARSRVQRIGQLNTPATGTHGSNSKVRGSDRIGLGLSPPRTQARTPTPTKTHRGSRSAANTSSAEPVASPLASKTEALLRHAASQHELRGLLQNPPGLIQLTERTMLLAIKAYTQHPEVSGRQTRARAASKQPTPQTFTQPDKPDACFLLCLYGLPIVRLQGPFHIVQPLRCQALIGNESGPLQDWVQLIHEYHTEAAHILLSDPQSTSALRAAMATLLPQMTSTAPTPAEMVSKVLYLIFTGAQYVAAGSLGLKAVQRTVAAQACGARAVRDVRADSTAVVIPPPCKGISGTHVVHCKWLTISAYLDKVCSALSVWSCAHGRFKRDFLACTHASCKGACVCMPRQ